MSLLFNMLSSLVTAFLPPHLSSKLSSNLTPLLVPLTETQAAALPHPPPQEAPGLSQGRAPRAMHQAVSLLGIRSTGQHAYSALALLTASLQNG